jgi:hypothetical protein
LDSKVQKALKWVKDRPDMIGLVNDREFLYCEVKCRGNDKARIAWDTQRLARFARSSIVLGAPFAPLIQVVKKEGTMMTVEKKAGLFFLQKVGTFGVPSCLRELGSLAVDLRLLKFARVS